MHFMKTTVRTQRKSPGLPPPRAGTDFRRRFPSLRAALARQPSFLPRGPGGEVCQPAGPPPSRNQAASQQANKRTKRKRPTNQCINKQAHPKQRKATAGREAAPAPPLAAESARLAPPAPLRLALAARAGPLSALAARAAPPSAPLPPRALSGPGRSHAKSQFCATFVTSCFSGLLGGLGRAARQRRQPSNFSTEWAAVAWASQPN